MTNERMTKAAVVLAALAGAVVFAVCAAEAAGVEPHGLITGDSVYVRSGEAQSYRAIGKLKKGEFVNVITVSNDGKWVRVVAPAQADVWIFAKFVKVTGGKGVVTGSKVRVRARPDLKGELVNRLDKGTALTVKGRQGDWLKIAPPKGTVAWIHAQYVRRMTSSEVAAYRRAQTDLAQRESEKKRLEAEKAKLEAELALKKKQAEEARLKAEVERKERVAELAAKRAEEERIKPIKEPRVKPANASAEAGSLKGGTKVTVRGWISYIGPGQESTGATHRVVKDGRLLALVKSRNVDLASFVGARVQVTGRTRLKLTLPGGQEGVNVVDVGEVQIMFN